MVSDYICIKYVCNTIEIDDLTDRGTIGIIHKGRNDRQYDDR